MELTPHKEGVGSLAFMFETAYILKFPTFAVDKEFLDSEYVECWKGLKNHFRDLNLENKK
jgi:homogentisate 1,2-dioxygenase